MDKTTKRKVKKFLDKFLPAIAIRFARKILRNKLIHGEFIKAKQVNLVYSKGKNLGDELSPIIYEWMLQQKGIDKNAKTRKTHRLLAVGSIVGAETCDCTIWGSGIQMISGIEKLLETRKYRKMDVRAVRGPLTLQAIWYAQFHDTKPHYIPAYGDPAILMPLIYPSHNKKKIYDVSVILHFSARGNDTWINNDLHYIDILTKNYKLFIDEIRYSKKIISSSLHGIILAESYGVPAIFLNTGGHFVEGALTKFYDWYYSTNRWSVKMARSIDEALEMEPMELPKLDELRKGLIDSFPYDLWK